MPETCSPPNKSREALERAFKLFQTQSELLEKSHGELKTQLAEIRERLAGTLESINDAIFIVTPANAGIEPANGAARALSATLALSSKTLLDIHPVARLLNAGIKVNDQNITLKMNGETLCWIVSVIPMRNCGAGREVVSIKDISAQRNLEIRLAREDRMAALGKVAASVAHEIRNPLAAIEGFAILLGRDLEQMPRQRALAEKTVHAARQLNSVVNNLLSYTREFTINPSDCRVNGLLLETIAFIQPMATDHGVVINFNPDPGLPGIKADSVMLRQVFSNIITNAVEACPRKAGGIVEIGGSIIDNKLTVVVADNGPGIQSDRKRRIFEPFFTMKEGGVGLGLALCQRIIDAHDGHIEECGVYGQGARFIIQLNLPEIIT